MTFFSHLSAPDINQGVEQFRATPGAVLVDVRTPEEYRQKHIPGSLNLPLDDLEQAETALPNRDAPLFVHCRSGVRSSQAVARLRRMGYTAVENIGGILDYTGDTEEGEP